MRKSALLMSKKKQKGVKRRAPVLFGRRRSKPKRGDAPKLNDWEFDGTIGDMEGFDFQQSCNDDDEDGQDIDWDEWEFDGGIGDSFDPDEWEFDGIIDSVGAANSINVKDGRYWGGNHRLILELRIDFAGSAVVSGDLFTNSVSGRHYLASFRTEPGLSIARSDKQPWIIILEDSDENTTTGKLALDEGVTEKAVSISLFIEGTMPGLPTRQLIEMSAEWQSSSMRVLSVEMESEEEVAPPAPLKFNGQDVTIASVLSDAGIELENVGTRSIIPKLPDGFRWGISQLHSLMTSLTSDTLARRQWRQQLLWLGTPSRRSLLGVMFDNRGELQRQGSAVFVNEIERFFPQDTARKLIQTTVHEIGHSLNLAHRFEREVGRADSTSIMNYDWRYRGGDKRHEYWKKFNFTFDEDELAFLRHGSRYQVIPGGAPFHSATYWTQGNGGYSPYSPEIESNAFSLHLTPPKGKDGKVFQFGQPVLLRVSITNNTLRPQKLNKTLLDPKSGFLQVLIKRVEAGNDSMSCANHFVPLYERCFDVDETKHLVTVNPGKVVADNLNITFGSSGFSFAEPGLYDIQVVGIVPINTSHDDPNNDHDLTFTSNKLRIYVSTPRSQQDEIDVANVLFRDDVGTFFALGGAKHLTKADSDLTEICDRRLHKRKTVCDPVAANIIRCKGIDAGRWVISRAPGNFKLIEGNPEAAAEHLRRLTTGNQSGFDYFDSETARTTGDLLKKYEGRVSKNR